MAPVGRVLDPNMRMGGKYVLSRRIASGGMGDVWVARNETTDAAVALKILRPSADERTQAQERFRREAKLGGLLTHRGIVRIFDFLEEPDGTLVLVMELLRGDTLEQFLAMRGTLTSREAVAILAPVLSALQHGHDHDVIHRDIKPANIFLSVEPDGRVIPKLLDFGIAKIASSSTKTIDGLVLGTPRYMSPEQISADLNIDGRSDLFSAGVVLYELLTGSCPFAAPTPSASIAAVLMTEVDPDLRIEPRLWLELQRALRKRPAERHRSASELASALLAAIDETEDGVTAVLRRSKPPPAMRETAPALDSPAGHNTKSVEGQAVATIPRRRTPAWVTWGAAAVIVATTAIVGATSLRSGTPRASAGAAPRELVNVSAGATTSSVGESAPSSRAGQGASAGGAPTGSVTDNAGATIELGSTAPSANSAPTRTTPKHVPRARPKPIATSPGF